MSPRPEFTRRVLCDSGDMEVPVFRGSCTSQAMALCVGIQPQHTSSDERKTLQSRTYACCITMIFCIVRVVASLRVAKQQILSEWRGHLGARWCDTADHCNFGAAFCKLRYHCSKSEEGLHPQTIHQVMSDSLYLTNGAYVAPGRVGFHSTTHA